MRQQAADVAATVAEWLCGSEQQPGSQRVPPYTMAAAAAAGDVPRRGFAFSSGVPPPPDHAKARAYREGSCPRRMRELSIYNFGENPDQTDQGRAELTAQCNELFHKLYPIVTADFQLQRRIEMDFDAKDLRYKMRVSNEFNANRLVKRMNGFKLGDKDEPWAPMLRRSYTQEKWDALIEAVGERKLKVSVVDKPKLTAREKAAETGDSRFARFGMSIYLYFFCIKRLARLLCTMAALALPAVALNLWGNLAAAPGCFDGEFPIAPFACATLVSAGNVPTFSQVNESASESGKDSRLSQHDRHLLFSFLDIAYTCVYLLGLHQLRTGARALTASSGDDSTAADYTIQVSGFPEDLRDPKLIRDFFEFRFGPVVEVSIATQSSRLLEACAELGQHKASLHIALARGRNRETESKRAIKLRAAVAELKKEIAELAATFDSDTDQQIVCAFVKFDKWEDCQKALNVYAGIFRGYLHIDHPFRWTGKPEVPGSVGAAQAKRQRLEEAAAKEKAAPSPAVAEDEGQGGGRQAEEGGGAEAARRAVEALLTWLRARIRQLKSYGSADSGGNADEVNDGDDKEEEEEEEVDLGHRLWVERAPEPASIIWEGFGHSPRSLWIRRFISAFVSLVLISCTIAAFVVAESYRGSAPATCDIAVCDDRWEYPLHNKNASFARAVLGTSTTEDGVTSIGLGCAHPSPAEDIEGPEEEERGSADAKATQVVFRSGLTNSIGRPTCLGGYEFCQGLEDEVRRDLEFSICAEAYFKARLFSSAGFEYLPWAVLVLVNVCLRWLVKPLVAKIECHTSRTAREIAVAKKLFVVQFINTVLAIWLAHSISSGSQSRVPGTAAPDATSGWGVTEQNGGAAAPAPPATEQTDGLLGAQWYRETGTGLTVALLINSLLPRAGVYLRSAWGRCARSRCCTYSCCVATQEQLNERYAGQHLDLSERYACVWNTIFSTMFYCSGMPVLLLIGAVDLSLLYHTEQKALFKYYSKRDSNDDNEELSELSAQLLNYAAPLHLIGAILMYTDGSVWAPATITDSDYAQTRARGRNTTVVVEGSSGVLDDLGDALGMRHVVLIILLTLGLLGVHLLKDAGPDLRCCNRKLPSLPALPSVPLPKQLQQICSTASGRLRRLQLCRRPCKSRVAPEYRYRTYTQSVDDMKQVGGLISYDVRDSPSLSAALQDLQVQSSSGGSP